MPERDPRFDKASRAAKKKGLGKLLPETLYIHKRYVKDLPTLLRNQVAKATSIAGSLGRYNIVKIGLKGDTVGFLDYPTFDTKPTPELARRVLVNVKTRKVQEQDYSDAESPPVLHRKETYVRPGYPGYKRFQKLTASEEAHGLLNRKGISTAGSWRKLLASEGLSIKGDTVMSKGKSRSNPAFGRTLSRSAGRKNAKASKSPSVPPPADVKALGKLVSKEAKDRGFKSVRAAEGGRSDVEVTFTAFEGKRSGFVEVRIVKVGDVFKYVIATSFGWSTKLAGEGRVPTASQHSARAILDAVLAHGYQPSSKRQKPSSSKAVSRSRIASFFSNPKFFEKLGVAGSKNIMDDQYAVVVGVENHGSKKWRAAVHYMPMGGDLNPTASHSAAEVGPMRKTLAKAWDDAREIWAQKMGNGTMKSKKSNPTPHGLKEAVALQKALGKEARARGYEEVKVDSGVRAGSHRVRFWAWMPGSKGTEVRRRVFVRVFNFKGKIQIEGSTGGRYARRVVSISSGIGANPTRSAKVFFSSLENNDVYPKSAERATKGRSKGRSKGHSQGRSRSRSKGRSNPQSALEKHTRAVAKAVKGALKRAGYSNVHGDVSKSKAGRYQLSFKGWATMGSGKLGERKIGVIVEVDDRHRVIVKARTMGRYAQVVANFVTSQSKTPSENAQGFISKLKRVASPKAGSKNPGDLLAIVAAHDAETLRQRGYRNVKADPSMGGMMISTDAWRQDLHGVRKVKVMTHLTLKRNGDVSITISESPTGTGLWRGTIGNANQVPGITAGKLRQKGYYPSEKSVPLKIGSKPTRKKKGLLAGFFSNPEEVQKVMKPVIRVFEQERGRAEKVYPDLATVALKIDPYLHDVPWSFGRTISDGLEVAISIAPELASEPVSVQRGIIRHEFGHAAQFLDLVPMPRRAAKGLSRYDTVERSADKTAEQIFGSKIFYDKRGVEVSGPGARGTRPRPKDMEK